MGLAIGPTDVNECPVSASRVMTVLAEALLQFVIGLQDFRRNHSVQKPNDSVGKTLRRLLSPREW